MLNQLRPLGLLIAVAALSAFVIACGGGDDPTATASAAPSSGTATAEPTAAEATGEPSTGDDRVVVTLAPPHVETFRPWASTWGFYFQHDPFMDTLLRNDPNTASAIPGLAEAWEVSSDFTTWTMHLREDVQFHDDWGELTARDVVHTVDLITREDSIDDFKAIWDGTTLEVVNDHELNIHFEDPFLDGEILFSQRQGDTYIFSVAQWESEGAEGLDAKPAGTGPYEVAERRLGESILYTEWDQPHWSGVDPDFSELEFAFASENSTRLAMLRTGEAQIGDISPELHSDAVQHGLEVLTSEQVNMQTNIWLGGLWFADDDPALDMNVPWTDVRVRQAMNKAIDRDELIEEVYNGRASKNIIHGWYPLHEGWNPEWAERFDEEYGYDPQGARDLLEAAGYGPGEMEFVLYVFVLGGQSENPLVAEALQLYWEDVGIDVELRNLEWDQVHPMQREQELKDGGFIIRNQPIRTTQEFIRNTLYTGPGSAELRMYTHDFIDERFPQYLDSTDLNERDQLAREMGNHMFENFTDIRLVQKFRELVVDPNEVEWVIPGVGPSGLMHFRHIQAVR